MYSKMSSAQKAAAHQLRDAINAEGVMDPGQAGPQEVSFSQVAKVFDQAQAWKRGEITLAALCEAAGWTAPAVPAEEIPADEQPAEEQDAPAGTTTCTLSVIRGDAGPEAHGEELGQSALEGVHLGAGVHDWLRQHGAGEDDLTWVLVTPGEEHPGLLANLVAQKGVQLSTGELDLGDAGAEDEAVGWQEAAEAAIKEFELATTVTTSVRNPQTGCWEIVDREPAPGLDSLDEVEVSAQAIGGELDQQLLVQLRDGDDDVLASKEITAR